MIVVLDIAIKGSGLIIASAALLCGTLSFACAHKIQRLRQDDGSYRVDCTDALSRS